MVFYKLNTRFLELCKQEDVVRFSAVVEGRDGVTLIDASEEREKKLPMLGSKTGLWRRFMMVFGR